MSATTGLTDVHRRAYDLLVNRHPNGLTRDALALHLGLEDRAARKIVEALRLVAATNPHPDLGPIILGFDPELQRYTYARDRAQADRILTYQWARAKSLITPLLAQVDAANTTFGQTNAPPAYQEALFQAQHLQAVFR